MHSLADFHDLYWNWLTRAALPLWAEAGVDPSGGFEELLDSGGRAVAAVRRSRVQGRQSFVFAYAGRLGWDGNWRAVAPVGLNYLDRYCRRDDGLYATLSASDGTIIDSTAMTYDQAFVILAAAEMYRHDPKAGWDEKALKLMDRIETLRRHDKRGFVEDGGRFLSNPHMHLLEACLAWVEVGGAASWRGIASEIVTLALDCFIDADRKVLREYFDSDWRPAPGDEGEVTEPGHQFEWAWLLERWSRLSGDVRAHDAAHALFAAGTRGVDRARNVALDETGMEMQQRRATARLWPQTERLKAALLLGEAQEAHAAADSLWHYLQTPRQGLWRDKMREDGSFIEEPAPASSLYHIICAVASLRDVT